MMVSGRHGNHFELFGLPVSFEIDAARLASRYRELQHAAHPDRFANASEQERRLSMEQAADINEAFNTLKQPISRAHYMLQLAGVEVDSESNTAMDPAFLMEQMELRERLAEVRGQNDPLAEVGAILQSIGNEMKGMAARIGGCFEQGGAALDEARDLVRKLQFLRKVEQEAAALEADLEDELI